MKRWWGPDPMAQARTRDGDERRLEVTTQEWSGWTVFMVRMPATEQLTNVRWTLGPLAALRELLTPAPNKSDVRLIHPSQTVCLAGTLDHPDLQFGPQWLFTPPPLALPLGFPWGWAGLAVAAPPGDNLFSAVSYRPREDGRVDVVVDYRDVEVPEGDLLALLVATAPAPDPYAVIGRYADALRLAGWAPSPRRTVPSWWREPFLCTWGEQCNLYHHHRGPRREPGQYNVTTYETEANQRRWTERLLAQGIPVGVVSTSDKWQRWRYRLIPDAGRYGDLRGFADWHHAAGRRVIAWWGLWNHDGAPLEWCIRDGDGQPVAIDPQHPGYREVLADDVRHLLSPNGYDLDGFFLDFTAHMPMGPTVQSRGPLAGLELLHDYVGLIYRAAKEAKPDAMVMTHCPHPYFADVTDVLRLNDWSLGTANVVEQARYRQAIAAACSDWLINTDNWPLYDIAEWRRYLSVQPALGIPASWFAEGVLGEGTWRYEAFTDDDYATWRQVWEAYRREQHLPEPPAAVGGQRA